MLADCFENALDADVYHETDDDAFIDYELKEIADIRQLVERSNGSHAVFKSIADSNRADELLTAAVHLGFSADEVLGLVSERLSRYQWVQPTLSE